MNDCHRFVGLAEHLHATVASSPLALRRLVVTVPVVIKELELELELIQTQMAQKPMLRAEVYARALRASQNVKRAEVWVGVIKDTPAF